MRIFGKRGVKAHLSTGTFTCPSCESTQVYTIKKVTNFVTLLKVPIIKADEEQPYVECQNCFGTYIPRVLDYDPKTRDRTFLQTYRNALIRALSLIVLTDSGNSSQKKMLMLSMLKKFNNQDLRMHDLELILSEESKKSDTAFAVLKRLQPQLNKNGRDLILKCALSVAMIDGPLTEFELVIISKLAEALGIPSYQLVSLISENESRSAA